MDLVLRQGKVVTPAGSAVRDVGIADGRIVEIAESISGSGAEELDLRDLYVFPGAVDIHVHLNEPGREDWEGLETGTNALAAGGVTTFFDMPLNSTPSVLDLPAFEAKRALAEQKSRCDFGLWGGLTPSNLEQLPALAAAGAIGFKAFLSSSGVADFPRADTGTLFEGMKIAAELGRIVAVHAENESITASLARRAVAEGRVSMRDYLDSRPVIAEVEAVQRVILLAWETGCPVHFVHISTGRAVQMITDAREQGADVTCETCPHYLLLSDSDAERLGAVAKCAPPLRSRGEQAGLWQKVLEGEVDLIASDHSPAPPAMKEGQDFFKIWGGISGAQHGFPLVLTESGSEQHRLPMERVAALFAGNPALRFGLGAHKGAIEVGRDADLAIVAHSDGHVIVRDSLRYRHALTPYLGRRLHAEIVRTLVRGQTIFMNGEMIGAPAGRLVRPGA